MADDRNIDAPGGEQQPGRPRGRDELDPELLALPRPRPRIGPLLSLSIIVLCLYIMLRVRADLRFSLQDEAPRQLDAPATLLAQAEALNDRFVEVRAVPDRSFAAHVATSQADPGSRLAPVQGTNGMLWIMLAGTAWTAGIQYDEVYAGRLRPVSDLPFGSQLRRHVASRPPAPRFVQPSVVRSALESKAAAVTDPAGDTIQVASTTPVDVYVTAGDRVHIEVTPTERHPTAEAWAEALGAAGLIQPGTQPTAGQLGAWIFTATAAGVDAARARLQEAKLFSASVEPIETVLTTTWGQLATQGNTLAIAGQSAPGAWSWNEITWISLSVPRNLPDRAWVLLTQERPETYWYVLPLFVVLGLSVLLFAWALVRSLRSPVPEPENEPAPAELDPA